MNRWSLLDKHALLITLTLCCLGILFIWSATQSGNLDDRLWIKQCFWVATGLTGYLFLSRFDYKKLVNHAAVIFAIAILSLILVLWFGHKINGARSWFRLPFMSIQPAEFVKIATALMLTKYYSRFQERRSRLFEFIGGSLLVAIPFVLILFQPDLGTAMVYLPFFFLPNFLLGGKQSTWVAVIGTLLATLLVLGVIFSPGTVFFLKDYQKDRIVSFVYPERDTSNTGYQVHQSKISIGEGGLFGKGLGQGQQTKLGFLPAHHNDFILAVVAEEIGFAGVAGVFLLFLFLFFRGFMAAEEPGDPMGSMLVVLIIGTLSLQMLFNAAMLVGLMPTTGINCPLLSYGGSSMLTTMMLLGLVQSVRTHRFVNH